MCDRDSLSHEAQANGSMLLASSAEEVAALEVRAAALQTQGVAARGLSAQQVARLEPAVRLPGDGGGLLVASDSQLVRKGVEFRMHAYYSLKLIIFDSLAASPPCVKQTMCRRDWPYTQQSTAAGMKAALQCTAGRQGSCCCAGAGVPCRRAALQPAVQRGGGGTAPGGAQCRTATRDRRAYRSPQVKYNTITSTGLRASVHKMPFVAVWLLPGRCLPACKAQAETYAQGRGMQAAASEQPQVPATLSFCAELTARSRWRRVLAGRAVVLCVGAWAGQLLDAALVGGGGGGWGRLITPLRGHLLQISAAAAHSVPRLTHGLMETAYTAVRFLHFLVGVMGSGNHKVDFDN